MNLLIDTHILLWWLSNDKKLPQEAEKLITQNENNVFVSSVCGWEIAIKHSLGRLEIDIDEVNAAILDSGFSVLPITMLHGLGVASLPMHHNDPFDRLLVAQCRCESMHLLTHDILLQKYGNFVIYV